MKNQIIYIHGGDSFKSKEAFLKHLRTVPLRDVESGGARPLRWSETLTEQLGETFRVIAPSMPNKQNADYLEWKIWFERYLSLVEEEVAFIGWSQGAYFLAKYLAENSVLVKIKGLFLVAGPAGIIEEWGGDNPEWVFDLRALGARLDDGGVKTYIFHSEDDPVVPYSHAQAYKTAIPQAELITFTDKGHFLVPELPELIDRVKEAFGSN